ncbi:outer membrane biosynthesis protein TonB/prefoldin subunit 5 [Lysobacter niastensis]|uniref:Outer membrane biosynthesis protein TonB/prefoldin subunit 5 n=1 Tax=Lysobacter niastensis TaxID=380629 RepID=A0ABU1WBL7_9GAMM|nr:AgmX/PglI C-terminal domain-containing protein [Lysobacter niastensis]MDR7134990.1 outer membrane biosynthesis protein TonB/prefoldin subunit 5 [Lysobacter niastensis]
MTDTNTMEPETIQDANAPGSLDERIAQARARLDELARDLAAIDDELETFAGERVRHKLLEQACHALEELNHAGGADLFWRGLAGNGESAGHIARARGRTESLRARIDEIETRRSDMVGRIGEQNEQLFLLEDEAFEHQEEMERQRNEWIVERELQADRVRPHLMLWMRGEEDQRSRKGLVIALCVWLVFALVFPFIKIPERPVLAAEKLPERVVTVIPEARKLEQAPPPPPELTRPVERKVERKPTPTRATAKVEPRPVPTPQPTAKPQGILAFKNSLAVDDMPAVAELGKAAKLSNDTGAARPERAMLTSNAPGGSSGINLSSESRSFGKGGGGERAAIKGVATTRATSGINAIAAADTAANGAARRGGRSDEEIQIVFDRHKSALYRLYQRELRNDATLQGKVILRLTIEPDGSVSMAQVKSSEMDAPGLTADIVARVRGFNFGAKDVPAVTIVYPMNFLPAG